MSIIKLSPNWACQTGPVHCPKFCCLWSVNWVGVQSMFLAMTNCTGERSFSRLKLTKSGLRSTMEQQCLNWFSLTCIENDIMKTIDFKPIIGLNQFTWKKFRKHFVLVNNRLGNSYCIVNKYLLCESCKTLWVAYNCILHNNLLSFLCFHFCVLQGLCYFFQITSVDKSLLTVWQCFLMVKHSVNYKVSIETNNFKLL